MDIIQVDVPLFLRLLELAREEVKDDADLHDIAQAVTAISKLGPATMAEYDKIVDFMQTQGSKAKPEEEAYGNDDIRRFRQIVDLATKEPITTQPREQYADISAVTTNAGGGMQAPKHPADIKGEHPSLYPGTVHGAR